MGCADGAHDPGFPGIAFSDRQTIGCGLSQSIREIKLPMGVEQMRELVDGAYREALS
jgi:hypothetical protein